MSEKFTPVPAHVDGSASQGEVLVIGVNDSRRAMTYLLVREAGDYIAIMTVLESSVTDMSPSEVTHALRAAGTSLTAQVVEQRLEKLRTWTAASARTDTSRVQRFAELAARNWRYTATPTGRQVHRFYGQYLAGVPAMREIPLSSLARVVSSLESLSALLGAATEQGVEPLEGVGELSATARSELAELVGRLFTSHDDLDGALVGAEDVIAGLSDRFDLDDEHTGELKSLLVDYATHVAAELEHGSARAHLALRQIAPYAGALAGATVDASDARTLIERGALTASRGGREADWVGLTRWFDPTEGRAAQFGLRLVRALPAMHANLRRLHTSAGTATSRARALSFARACQDPTVGSAVLLAALGDHSWRKLAGSADEEDLARGASWRQGPGVGIPDMLRSPGRSGSPGRAPAARDDAGTRLIIAARRAARANAHSAALREVLTAGREDPLSDLAARVALAAALAASRAASRNGHRTGSRDGLACTLMYTGRGAARILAPTWQVLIPGRVAAFHLPGQAAPTAAGLSSTSDLAEYAEVTLTLAAGGSR